MNVISRLLPNDRDATFTGSAWLVTFPKGRNYESFMADATGMQGTSPFALVEEVNVGKRQHEALCSKG